jgi:hypothetical protein
MQRTDAVLGVRGKMIAITVLDGHIVDVDDDDIIFIAGPYPHDVGPHSYVHLSGAAVLVTREGASQLARRLDVTPHLVQLTRPNVTPVWIKGSAVIEVRATLPTEAGAHSVAIVGGLHQALMETVEVARQAITRRAVTSEPGAGTSV